MKFTIGGNNHILAAIRAFNYFYFVKMSIYLQRPVPPVVRTVDPPPAQTLEANVSR